MSHEYEVRASDLALSIVRAVGRYVGADTTITNNKTTPMSADKHGIEIDVEFMGQTFLVEINVKRTG